MQYLFLPKLIQWLMDLKWDICLDLLIFTLVLDIQLRSSFVLLTSNFCSSYFNLIDSIDLWSALWKCVCEDDKETKYLLNCAHS